MTIRRRRRRFDRRGFPRLPGTIVIALEPGQLDEISQALDLHRARLEDQGATRAHVDEIGILHAWLHLRLAQHRRIVILRESPLIPRHIARGATS